MKINFELLFPTPVMFTEMDREFTKDELNFVDKHSKDDMTNRNVGNVTSNNVIVTGKQSWANSNNAVAVSQIYNSSTNSLDIVFG